jgi:hypothetical protein
MILVGTDSNGCIMQDTVRSFQYLGFLGITALLCGAVVMVVEVVGARIISPFFGVSLFVWTSLIAVTLLSLSLGYVLGGILADRKPHARVMYLLIFVAGLAVMAIPLLKGFVLVRSMGVGLRAGSLLSATVLFAPSLLLLGCVSPYLVRLSARELLWEAGGHFLRNIHGRKLSRNPFRRVHSAGIPRGR